MMNRWDTAKIVEKSQNRNCLFGISPSSARKGRLLSNQNPKAKRKIEKNPPKSPADFQFGRSQKLDFYEKVWYNK